MARTITTPNGRTFEVVSRQPLDGLPNLQKQEPNTAAYLFCAKLGRSYLVRELKDGTLTNATRL